MGEEGQTVRPTRYRTGVAGWRGAGRAENQRGRPVAQNEPGARAGHSERVRARARCSLCFGWASLLLLMICMGDLVALSESAPPRPAAPQQGASH